MAPKKTPPNSRILIVDDHPAVRESLASWIARKPGLEVCGEAADMNEALRLVAETEPELAVIDISLKNGNGIDLIKRIKDRTDKVRILVWSTHSEALYAQRALRAGALGYINKEETMDKLMKAIQRVLEGKVYLSNAMTENLLQRAVGEGGTERTHSPVEALADRELEVFRLVGEGIKTAEIAKKMHLSVHTVETYRERIKAKLGLKSGTELVHFATQWAVKNT